MEVSLLVADGEPDVLLDNLAGKRPLVVVVPAREYCRVVGDVSRVLAKHVAPGFPASRVLQYIAPVRADEEQVEGYAFDGGTQPRLALPQRLLRVQALGDVHRHAHHLETARGIAHGSEAGVEPGVAETRDKVQGLAVDGTAGIVAEFRIAAVKLEQGLSDRFAGGQTDACQALAFAEREDAALVELEDGQWGTGDHGPVALLALRQVLLALADGEGHPFQITRQAVELPDPANRPRLAVIAGGDGVSLFGVATDGPRKTTSHGQRHHDRQHQRHQRAGGQHPSGGQKRSNRIAAGLRDQQDPAEARNADRGANKHLAVHREVLGRAVPQQGIADAGQVVDTERRATLDSSGMGDDLALSVENDREHRRFGGRATKAQRESVEGDLADEHLFRQRNCHAHGEPAGDGGQEGCRPHFFVLLARLAQGCPFGKIKVHQIPAPAALRPGQADGVRRAVRIGEVDRREHIARAGVRVQGARPVRR